MKMYEAPDYELIKLSVYDVITASDEEEGGEGGGGGSGWELPPIPLK